MTSEREHLERVRALYDRFSEVFLACAGDTFQAGLARLEEREDPRASNLYLAERAGLRPGQRVLDAGCGICGPAIHIAGYYPGMRIDAVTLSPVQVRLGRQRVAEAGLSERITVHEADYHALPFEAGVFDAVLFFECTGYSREPARLFAEVHRVLKPGGAVYIKDVFQEEVPGSEEARRQQREFDEMWALHESPTLSGTVAQLRGAGFEDVDARRFTREVMSGFYFIGAMFGREEGVGPLELNAFGRHFYRSMAHLPSYFGEVRARKPA